MADIRVERKSGGRAWLWILLALVLLVVAALLLDRAGYIDLPVNFDSVGAAAGIPAQLALSSGIPLQEG